MLAEHLYRPIHGRFLSIGKQTVSVSPTEIRDLFNQFGISTRRLDDTIAEGSARTDRTTRKTRQSIFDHDLIAAFSDATYDCLDRSEYEGANVIHDLTKPIPPELAGQFDFVYDGGCLDNIFDPTTALRNMAALVRPGGRLLHFNVGTAYAGAYLSFSPEWFFSYYAVNGFTDCKTYCAIAREPEGDRYIFDTDLYFWQPFFTRQENYDYVRACQSVDGAVFVICIAEKDEASTVERTPTQMQYLDEQVMDWRREYQRFAASPRPLLSGPRETTTHPVPLLTDHFEFRGGGF